MIAHLIPQAAFFIGRNDELTDISALIHNPLCRLLTLVGPGGIGKTRLALEIASSQQGLFPDGAHIIYLQATPSADLLVSAVAESLDFRFQLDGDPQSQLIHYLRHQSALLVLDNFEHLADGAASGEQVAQACLADPFVISALLDYFCAAQILEKDGDLYSLTPTAVTFLVHGRPAYVGDMILDYTGRPLFESILVSIRTGEPRTLNENFVQDAWLESYSLWRIPKSLEMWRATGVWSDGQKPLRILDIACGCAIKSLALAQSSPNVYVTCLDAPEILAVARDLAGRMGIWDQATFLPADLFTADLGHARFDAVLIGQISHYLTPEQNGELYGRVHTALKAGGTLLIDCPMSQTMPTESAAFLTLFLWANGGGAVHPFADYQAWLAAAGFSSIRQLSERWLAAKK